MVLLLGIVESKSNAGYILVPLLQILVPVLLVDSGLDQETEYSILRVL